MTPLIQRACLVCGSGSTRPTWTKSKVVNGTMYVACDSHSDAEFQSALAKVVPAAPTPPAVPNTGTTPPANPTPNGGTK
jgi:hypothetical protein